jgi:hypothetical protein
MSSWSRLPAQGVGDRQPSGHAVVQPEAIAMTLLVIVVVAVVVVFIMFVDKKG